MSELAFNVNGEEFEVPVNVAAWRVRRLKPRGAPELVYGKDGKPLVVPIEIDIEGLREEVGLLGRYRLDPVDDHGKIIADVPAAYVQVVRPEQRAPEQPTPRMETDSVLKEAMRLNTELAKSIVDRFPEMMHAAAELLRAADGAGLPARHPRVEAEDEGDEDDEVQIMPGGFDLNAIVAQVVPALVGGLMNGGKLPGIGEMLDWRTAAPKPAKKATAVKSAGELPAAKASNGVPVPITATESTGKAVAESLPIDPATMAHFVAIQSALAPEEAALARAVAAEFAPVELRAWFDELRKLSVPEAVEKIRGQIGGKEAAQ